MKILFSSIVDLKKSQHNRPHQFVKYLSKNHDVTVFSINDWWKGGQENLDSYSKEFNDVFDRIEYKYLTNKKISPILQELLSTRKVKEVAKGDFDVHFNYNTLISGYSASSSIKTVYDMADDLSAMIKESPQIPKLLRPFGGMLGDNMIRKNISISELVTVTTENLLQPYHVPRSKSEVLPNGVNTSHFKNYASTKEQFGLSGFIIGYVGVLREWVNFEPIFLALKELNVEIKMLIVGKEGRYQETVELANKCDVSDRVIFAGMVPYSKVPHYISAMDICVIPFNNGAISENALPLKLFEYMACEKPIVSTELQGVKNAAGNLVMYASNKDEYKNKITELYNNDLLRSNMGTAGRQFVETNYEWEKIAGRLEEILVEVAAR